jgi:hypothetical protein
MRARAAMLATCLLAAGCGGSDDRASATRTPTPTPPANGPEAQPGGAGDEEPIAQKVRFTVQDDRSIAPRQVKVHALLGIDLTLRNRSSREHLISLVGPGLKRGMQLGPRLTVTTHLDGLHRGRFAVEVEDGDRATLISSLDEP